MHVYHESKFQFYYLLLILFQTSMICIGIFVVCPQIGESSPPPQIFFSFAPAHEQQTVFPKVCRGYQLLHSAPVLVAPPTFL